MEEAGTSGISFRIEFPKAYKNHTDLLRKKIVGLLRNAHFLSNQDKCDFCVGLLAYCVKYELCVMFDP